MNETRGLWHGKRLDNGEWIIGYLMRRQGTMGMTFSYIIPAEKSEFDFNEDYIVSGDEWIPVETKNLGECTGLSDKNGKPIFEGNIVKAEWSHLNITNTVIGVVEYDNAAFFLETDDHYLFFEDNIFSDDCDVIGNIHDNPESLKGEDQ